MRVYFDNIWAFLMHASLSTDVPVLLLNQPLIITQRRVRVVLRLHKVNYQGSHSHGKVTERSCGKSWNLKFAPQAWKSHGNKKN